jgi:hypothetical protein
MTESQQIQTTILNVHQELFGNHLIGIILCGSVNDINKLYTPLSDVDYIVVVDEITEQTLRLAAESRITVSKTTIASISNTIITRDEVALFSSKPEALDSKAAQALIEAANRPDRILGTDNLSISLPRDELIRNYSLITFGEIKQLIRHAIIRSDAELPPPVRHKIAKLCLIALKRLLQYHEPTRYSDSAQYAPDAEAFDDWQMGDFFDMLHQAKANPEAYNSHEFVRNVVNFLHDADELLSKHQ